MRRTPGAGGGRRLVRGVVRRPDGRGDAAALADLVAVRAGPLADVGHLLLAARRGRAPGAAAAALRRCNRAAARAPTGTDVRRERVTQLGGVVVADVDLVRRPVEPERDGLAALDLVLVVVQVAHEHDLDLLRHSEPLPGKRPRTISGNDS